MVILPASIPDIRIDYNQGEIEFTARDTAGQLSTPPPIRFKIVGNTLMGFNMFGNFAGQITFESLMSQFTASNLGTNLRLNESAFVTALQVKFQFFAAPFNVTGVFINDVNILASPTHIVNDQFTSAVLIDSVISVPENAEFTFTEDSGSFPELTFLFTTA